MTTKELKELAPKYIKEQRINEEWTKNTVLQYERAINVFLEYLEENGIENVTKETVIDYKAALTNEIEKYQNGAPKPKDGRRPITSYNTLNIRIRAINAFFKYIDAPELQVKKITLETSNTNAKALTDTDYLKLLEYMDTDPHKTPEKIKLIFETLAATGIRIGELKAITVESLKERMPQVKNKGKVRTIFIPKGIAKKLRAYCRKNHITQGIIFKNQAGDDVICANYIRQELKKVAGKARMPKNRVFLHNLRHLFAQRYISMPGGNPYVLADLLGHSGTATPGGVTSLYTRKKPKEILAEVDALEAYVNKILLPEAKKKRDIGKRKAQKKKETTRKRTKK